MGVSERLRNASVISLVVVETHFNLYNLERRGLVYLGGHLLGVLVIAYGVRGVWSFIGVETPYFIPRLTHDFAGKVVQGNVDRCLGRTVVGRNLVHVFVYIIKAEGVGELSQVERVEILANAVYVLAQIGGMEASP